MSGVSTLFFFPVVSQSKLCHHVNVKRSVVYYELADVLIKADHKRFAQFELLSGTGCQTPFLIKEESKIKLL